MCALVCVHVCICTLSISSCSIKSSYKLIQAGEKLGVGSSFTWEEEGEGGGEEGEEERRRRGG